MISGENNWANIDCFTIERPNSVRNMCYVEVTCNGQSVVKGGEDFEVWAGATDEDEDGDDDPFIMWRPTGGQVTGAICLGDN